MPLLEVTGLNLFLRSSGRSVQALRHLSFKLERGGALGLIGESGSGKSLTAMTLMGLQPQQASVTGSLQWEGQELLGSTERQWQALRGNRMAMVFQEPMTALNPVHTIGRQVAEPMVRHLGLAPREALKAATGLLERVGIPEPSVRVHDYPHQFSGGQRQRIAIARALVLKPRLILLDEPTSALDRTVQRQVVELLRNLQAKYNLTYLFISHDLAVVKALSHQLMVIKQGQVVEQGDAQAIFADPQHAYTQQLLKAAFLAAPDDCPTHSAP